MRCRARRDYTVFAVRLPGGLGARRSRGASLLGVCLLASGAGAGEASLRDWIEGPVRYIATPAEIDAFKALEDDESRAAFIEAFWARRDPEPRTLVNEYRQLFWQRVREANERFLDSPRPGWMTDRGKIHILYGAPQRIEEDPYAEFPQLAPGTRGVLRWHYEGRPGGRPDLGPVVVVPFVRDASGEYRLSFDPKLASEFFDLDALEQRSFYEQWLQVDLIHPNRSPLAVMLDLGRMQEVPPQEEVLLERIETREFYTEAILPLVVHRLRDPQGRGVVLSLTVAPPDVAGGAVPAVIAKLQAKGSDRRYVLGQESFRFVEGRRFLGQARVVVQPGTYTLIALAVYPGSSLSRVALREIPVEPFAGEGLQLSDVVLARELEPVRYQALRGYEEPFIVGAFRAVPRVSPRVPQGEPIALLYEVYGGEGPYRVTYSLEARAQPDQPWQSVGRPVEQPDARGAQGWAVPTSPAWPLGEYRVRISVSDVAGAAAEAFLSFELAPQAQGEAVAENATAGSW